MRVTIKREDCTSCAACWDGYPEIFEENEKDGLAQLRDEFRVSGDLGEGEVPDGLVNTAKSAAEDCPSEVIRVEE